MAKLDGSEQVLCVPARRLDAIGLYQGFRPLAAAESLQVLSLVLDRATFRPRTEELEHGAEGLLWLQIIPYTVLVARGPAWETPSLRGPEQATVFAFRRPTKGGDSRLAGRGSVGIGGHVNPVDDMPKIVVTDAPPQWGAAAWALTHCLRREIREEVRLEVEEQVLAGLLYDGRDDVGQRHLGLVCTAMVDPSQLRPDRAEVEPMGWRTPAALMGWPAAMWEGWSAILVPQLDAVLGSVVGAA
jgi:predicted NUDIX family phosphoesterase